MDVMQLGPALIAAYPGRNWLEQCERADWNAMWFALGKPEPEPRGYNTAKLSHQASQLSDGYGDPGDSLWWSFPPDDHTMIHLGNGYAFGATGRGKIVHDFGHGLVVIEAASYPAPFLGHAKQHGVWPTFQLTYTPPAPAPSGQSWAFNQPDAATQKRIQAALAKRGRYHGPLDGVWGAESIKGIQTTIKNVGYAGAIDGVPGVNTCHYVQVYAQRFGSYTGPIDNVLGPNGWAGFALGLERP